MKAVLKEQVIPPLSQSRHSDMACETLYVQKHVQHAKVAESGPATRGIEIHQILATYINHLARTRRATDLEGFDALMRGAGTEASGVLSHPLYWVIPKRGRNLMDGIPRNFTGSDETVESVRNA